MSDISLNEITRLVEAINLTPNTALRDKLSKLLDLVIDKYERDIQEHNSPRKKNNTKKDS